MKKDLFLLFIASLFGALSMSVQAQTTWTLQQCVTYAWENNLQMKQAELTQRNAELTLRQSQLSRLPTVNGQSNLGFQFGRTVDPTTNAFNTERIGFNSFSINAGVTLFSGNQINQQIEQSKLNLDAAKMDAQATANDIGLLVANTYLTVLLAEEQSINARRRLELSQAQLAQMEILIRSGARPINERLDIEATIARNEQAIIEANNLVTINYLGLKQLLQLDPATPLKVEQPAVALPDEVFSQQFDLETVYAAALQSQPQIRAAELRLESAAVGEKLAQASLWPTLTAFGSLSTSYSSAARDFFNPNTENATTVANPPQTILVNDTEVTITTFREEGLVYPRIGYGTQINENFGQSLGLSLSVPIYNNHRNRIAIERAQLSSITANVQRQQQRDQLKTNIQRSITDFMAARESYRAAQRSQDAAKAAFDNANRRFELGAINNLEFTTAANNLDQARVELSRAKYQLLFNLKVVEFYEGKPLKL